MSARNSILITVDSLRADTVYDDGVETPTFDSLRKNGTDYRFAFAQGPFTTFSMPSLFTSRYPTGLQYVEFSESTVGVYIDDEPTLPELFQEQGYDTAGFHSNPLLSNLLGFDRGFDTFDARLPLSSIDFLPGRSKILADKFARLFRKHPYLPAEALNRRALNWLQNRQSSRPFFLWLHYMDVHGPYQPKAGNAYLNKYRAERLWRKALKRPAEVTDEERERLRSWYRAEVEYIDKCLGRLFDELRTSGIFDETVVVVTADHGEQFAEHGRYSHPHQLYDELIHVPLLVRVPGATPISDDRLVPLLDVAPTLLEATGMESPRSFAGRSLLRSDETPEVVSEANLVPEYVGAIRTDQWKYLRDGVEGTEALFDLDADPDEQRNRAADNPETVALLADRLDEHLAAEERSLVSGDEPTGATIEDAETRDRLRDLGYLE